MAEQVEHEATARLCQNMGGNCGRTANYGEYEGVPMCKTCVAAQKQSKARIESREAKETEVERKLNAHATMLAALEAVFPMVTARLGAFVHTCYQTGEVTEKSRNKKAELQALFDQLAAAIAAGRGEAT